MPDPLPAPVVIDLGKVRRKDIKRLRRGCGPLVKVTQQALEELRAGMGPEAEGRTFLPVVLVYRKKEKRGRRLCLRLPFVD